MKVRTRLWLMMAALYVVAGFMVAYFSNVGVAAGIILFLWASNIDGELRS